MSNQSGYVYLLKNEAMPGIYKIGMTNRSVEERVKELSLSTSIPLPFEVVCSVKVDNATEAEGELHEEYSEFRIASNREFFKFDEQNLKDVISSFANYSLCKIYDSQYEFEEIYGDNLEGKLIHIASQNLNMKPICIEDSEGNYKKIQGSMLMSLLALCYKLGDKVLVPMTISKLCTINEYKEIIKKNIEPQYLKYCIDSLGPKGDLFNLKVLLED